MEETKKQGLQPSNNFDPTQHEYYDADTHNVTPFSRRIKVVANILLLIVIIAFAIAIWFYWQELAMYFI